jgi:phosphate transport system substrate-binding protein
MTVIAAVAVVAGVIISAPANAAGVSIAGKGSSFANGMLQTCAALYTTNTVSYTSTGSGTGRTEFAAGNVPWAASDGQYTSGYPNFNYTTVPLFGGPVAFVYSAVGVGDGLNLNASIVSGIFKGTITKWNDAAIKALNTKVKLPNKSIKVAYRASGSGTTANLTSYLNQTVGGWLANNKDLVAAAGGSGSFATNSTSFATSQLLAEYVENNSNAFGYFDLSDAMSSDVGIAKLQNAAGTFVMPTAAAAGKFLNAQTIITGSTDANNGTLGFTSNGSLVLGPDFTKVVPGAYQLSIVTYGLAPRFDNGGNTKLKSTDATKLAVQDFFNYVVKTCVPQKAALLGYVPLGSTLKTAVLTQIKNIG